MKQPNKMRREIWRIAVLPLLACAVFLILEFFNRRDVLYVFRFLVERPWMCLLNISLILATLLFGNLFPKKRAFISLITAIWIGCGITDYIMVAIRVQPFTFADIEQLGDGIALMTLYFAWWQIVAIFLGGFLLVAGLVLLFTKVKKVKINYARAGIAFAGGVLSFFLMCTLSVNAEALPRRFDNLVEAFDEYGFAYCFANSVSQSGIDKPDDYSEENVGRLIADMPGEDEEAGMEGGAPNIIFLQLESFFDVNSLNDIAFNENPIPNFTQLMREWPSAEIYVPSVGGGTANTEFEVLTGMCLDFFGAGEYPYNTILQKETCESICFNLAEEGYVSTALHNYTGTFYGRNEVYSRLGFNRFVSLEYMSDAKFNSLGWCMDDILQDEAFKAMRSTQERDFLFAITVQTHGKYADELMPDSDVIEVLSAPENIYLGQLTNYANSLYRTDRFIGEFLAALEGFNEPVVVVLYGDHLPAVGLDAEMLKDGNLYETQYVIWNNYGAKFTAENLEAYQLGSRILNQMDIEGGYVCRYHAMAKEENMDEETYLKQLEMLEYDFLYGEQEAYDGEVPYVPTELQMGSVPIAISRVDIGYDRICLLGANFTDSSRILVNGEELETIYVSSRCLAAQYDGDAEGVEVCVAQFGNMNKELSRTETFLTE